MADATTSGLPQWDFSQYFAGLDTPDYTSAFDTLKQDIATFAQSVEEQAQENVEDPAAAFDAMYGQINPIIEQAMLLMSMIHSVVSVDTRNELGNRRASELELAMLPLMQAQTRLTAWIGTQDVERLIETSDLAKQFAYQVRRAKTESDHQMTLPEEDLASAMSLSGGSAFGKLQADVSSQILVTFEKRPGEEVTLPMSEVRNLAMDPDRAVRRRAFEAELGAWELWQTPIAAALNGVKGEHTTLAANRHWDSVLDHALFQNQIDRETLDAMMDAAREAFPDIRRYWAAKAKMLGVDKLAWFDIAAPLGENTREWSYDAGMAFVKEQFATFSPKMAEMVQTAMDEQWIDAEPRAGKVDGAFCMGTRDGKSGVLANYMPSFDSVSTMAHELGHAYHNLCQKDVPALLSMDTPMTLAETASTFCETILRKAAIANGTDAEKVAILEGALQDAGQIVVDITSRFLFEQAVVERRPDGELSVEEFKALMIDAQQQTYGDAIAKDALHPYMWAVKSHYYSSNYAFYNYPYMFGLLFGLGLYAKYQDDPDAFRANYDDLLAATGSDDAATLAARFGIDVRTKEFWASSLNVIRQDVDEFCALAG